MCLFSPYCPYNEKKKSWKVGKCEMHFFFGGGAKYKIGVQMTKKGCEKLFYPYFFTEPIIDSI